MAFRDLTHGSIPRLIVVLALPVFGSFVLQSLYALADLYFVGLLGGAPLAGLGISLNIFFLVLALGQTIGIGSLAVLSRSFGAGQVERVGRFYQQSMLLVLIVGGVFWLLAYLGSELYFSMQTSDPEVIREGTAYFRIFSATLLIQVFLMVNGFSRRALGDFITPTLLMGSSVIINIVLDPIMIFGWGPVPAMGIRGAAWATVLSQLASAVVYLRLMMGSPRNPYLVLRKLPMPHWATIGQILKIGTPSGTQFVLFTVMNLIMYAYVKPFGAEGTAAITVGFRIIHSSVLPAVAICSAVSSVVGQNFGARNWLRIRGGIFWGGVFSFFLLSLEYLALALAPGFWVGLFADTPEIIAVGSDYLIIVGAAIPMYSLGMAVIFGMQGMGRTMIPLGAMMARVGGFVATLVVMDLAGIVSIHSVLWANALSVTLETVIMMVVAFFVTRKMNREFPPLPKEKRMDGPESYWQESVP